MLASTYPRWSADTEPAFVHELARRLTDRFDVVVSCPHSAGAKRYEMLDGVRVYRYRYAPDALETLVNDGGIIGNLQRSKWKLLLVPAFLLAQFWSAIMLTRSLKPAVIHAHWLIPQGAIGALVTAVFGGRLLVTSHGADLFALRSSPFRILKRWVIGRAKHLTVVSHAMLADALALGAEEGRLTVEPMGVDLLRKFSAGADAARSADELLFVGRLVEKKGLKHLIQALPSILSVRPRTRLIVAGFGPEEGWLREQARQLGVDGCVNFLGAVPQDALPDLYRRAALMVAPFVRARSGDQEGLGLVVIEAIGCECPVLAGYVPAMRDIGVQTVNAEDPEALVRAILDCLQEDSRLVRERARRLKLACRERFSWEAVAARYGGLIDKLMADVRP